MKINKQKLQDTLTIVEPGLGAKDSLFNEQSNFIFKEGRVYAYNNQIIISHPVEGLTEIGAGIDASKLFKLLGKLKSEEIDIEIKDSELLIKSGRAKAGLGLQSEANLPEDVEQIIEENNWLNIPESFVKSLSFVAPATSKDKSRPLLMMIHISDKGYVEATDSYRVARFNLEEGFTPPNFLLPATSALEVVKTNPTLFKEGSGWVFFKNEDGTVIACRIVSDKDFVSTDGLLKIKGKKVSFSEGITEVLERAKIFAERSKELDEKVIVSFGKKTIKLSSINNNDWYEEEIESTYEGEEIVFAITPCLLRDILAETLAFTVDEKKSKLKFEGGSWQYITALKTV